MRFALWIPMVAILETGLSVGVAHLFRDGLDRALAGEGQYILYTYGLIAAIIASALVIAARELLVGLIRERTTADLRYRATKQLTYLPMPVLDSMHSGDNLSRLTNDLNLVKGFLGAHPGGRGGGGVGCLRKKKKNGELGLKANQDAANGRLPPWLI